MDHLTPFASLFVLAAIVIGICWLPHIAIREEHSMAIAASDLERAHEVIRDLRLRGPQDGPNTFTWPKDEDGRIELADLVYDLADEYAARAVLDAPSATRTTY